MELVVAARALAEKWHAGAFRGCGVRPYVTHPIYVALLVREHGGDEEAVAAALLHDVLEDTDCPEADILALPGATPRLLALVKDLTDPKGLKKKDRRMAQLEHVPAMEPAAALVKVADKIANVTDLVEHPPDWDADRKREYVMFCALVVGAAAAHHPIPTKMVDTFMAVAKRAMAAIG